jgi:hypothetical protein
VFASLFMDIVVLTVAGLGFLFLLLSFARLRKRRLLSAGGHGFTGGLLLAIAFALGAVAINLHTYQRLTHEQPVATLAFKRVAPQQFNATVHLPSGERQAFIMNGDEWQLDARVLKWEGLAVLLGLDTRFRLERLSGRYRSITLERTAPRSVYRLSAEPGLDIWTLAQRHERWLPWMDATYGSATYLPMSDKARYVVHLAPSGLIGRALNGNARRAIRRW